MRCSDLALHLSAAWISHYLCVDKSCMLPHGTGALWYWGKPSWLHGSWEHGRLAQTWCCWMLSHSPWMQSTVRSCTHALSLGVGWWHGDGQSLRSVLWRQPVLEAGRNLESTVSIARGCVDMLCKWWGANWLACSSLCWMDYSRIIVITGGQ